LVCRRKCRHAKENAVGLCVEENGENKKSHKVGVQKKMWLVCKRKCRLGERMKSHQVGVQEKMGRIKNPIRLVFKRKCRLGEKIKSHHQVGVQKKM